MNQLKIEPAISYQTTKYYYIFVKRKWWIFSYWGKIVEYNPVLGWTSLLLKYSEAKAFAIKMKDPAALKAFEKEQLDRAENDVGEVEYF